MSKRAYSGGVPKADKRGYYRPEVGGVRFTLGHKSQVSEGEVKRRLDAIRDLFNKQAESPPTDPDSSWHSTALGLAKQIAQGQRPMVRPLPPEGDDPAVEHIRGRVYGYHVYEARKWLPDVLVDEPMLRQQIADQKEGLRARLQQSITQLKDGVLAEARDSTPAVVDPSKLETRTFFSALQAYRERLKSVGKRDSAGNLTTRVRKQKDRIRYIEEHQEKDFPLWQLDYARLDEITAYWVNRPTTRKGNRCSRDHARDMLKDWWAFLRWLDKNTQWQWHLPDRAEDLKRPPVRLPEDDTSEPFSTINKPTYTPEELAIIATHADAFGRTLIAVCVNCAFGASEVGQWPTRLYSLHKAHPHATGIGFRSSGDDSWITGKRPKTGVYGEHLLWPEVANALVPFLDGRQVLPLSRTGKPWYRTSELLT